MATASTEATSTNETAPHGYSSNPFGLIKPTWEAFKLIWVKLLLLLLGLMLASFVGGLVVVLLASFGGIAGTIIACVVGLVALVYGGGYFGWASNKLTIAAARGEKLSVKAAVPTTIAAPFKLFATGLLQLLAVLGGLLLLIVPGIIFGAWFSVSTYVVVEEGVWGVAALKRSREITRGRTWDVLGTIGLPNCISLISVIPVLGPLVYFAALIVLTPLYAVRYNQLLELKKQPDWQTVPTNGWVYVVVIVGLMAGGGNNFHSLSNLQHNSTPLEKNPQAY